MEKFCQPLLEGVWDASVAEKDFIAAAAAVDAVAKGNFHRDHIRTTQFTEALRNHCLKTTATP